MLALIVSITTAFNTDESTKTYYATPLHEAVIKGNLERVKELLDGGAKVDRGDETAGHTPLHNAAHHGHPNIAALLIERGANIEATSWDGITPLHLAASAGHHGLVTKLLDRNPILLWPTTCCFEVESCSRSVGTPS